MCLLFGGLATCRKRLRLAGCKIIGPQMLSVPIKCRYEILCTYSVEQLNMCLIRILALGVIGRVIIRGSYTCIHRI